MYTYFCIYTHILVNAHVHGCVVYFCFKCTQYTHKHLTAELTEEHTALTHFILQVKVGASQYQLFYY